ncbi:hypothetical protein PFISCL1PPCAC_10742 [Pristionchus fissidentatus]|uniref:CHK kinase-like domain-containing protein n=1 Tax=Pristionchus fissidentatus TaxID=1538716 RepID=A0AAV5VIE8_9BILA|nr:hypothetical protein PFISCL1PPCAC_10742 [Pristionchus fissidentatus]
MSFPWLATALQKKFGVMPTVGTSGPITEGSHGYMAQIRRVTLEWPIERADLPKSVVIKSPVAGSAADAWMAAGEEVPEADKLKAMEEHAAQMKKVQEMCHCIESQVYGLFDDDSYPAPCPMPKTYASFGVSHDHPSIIMEDITGATIYDIADGWTEKQLYTILDSIIDIHVMSFTTDKWKKIDYPVEPEVEEHFAQMANEFAGEILKRQPLPSLEKVKKHVLSNTSWFMAMYEKYATHPLSVFVHGDMWAPQFLWRGDTLAAIVDWQLTHPGSIMEDFLRLITLGISHSIRKSLTPILLQYYYSQITTKLAAKGVPVPFTFDEMMEEYKLSLPYSCGMAVFAFSMWSNSPVLKKGKDDDTVRIGEMFSRMAGLLEECVEAYGW